MRPALSAPVVTSWDLLADGRCSHARPRPCRTKLVEDSRRAVPQYRGLIHGTKEIVKAEGFLGIYRGLSAVVRVHRFA